jgi:hypothetical protein
MSRKERNSSGDQGEVLFDLVQSAVDKIDKLTSKVETVDKKLDIHILETKFGFQRVEATDIQQNKILEEHHQRSTELKRDNDLREKDVRKEIDVLGRRLARVEEPRKWLATTRSLILWTAGTVGAVITIGGFAKGLYEALMMLKQLKGG